MESEAITDFGRWGRWDECDEGQFVYGFSVKVEPYRGSNLDNTIANGIRFDCRHGPTGTAKEITSTVQQWGSWTQKDFCTNSGRTQYYVKAVRLLVQPYVEHADDMATLAIEIKCENDQIKKGG